MPLTFTFTVRSIVNDTPETRAESRREFETILRYAGWYFTDAELKRLVTKITKRGKPGRKPQARTNELMLDEYDAAVREAAPKPVNKANLARGLCEKYHLHSPDAVEKQLDRLLNKRREAEAKKKG